MEHQTQVPSDILEKAKSFLIIEQFWTQRFSMRIKKLMCLFIKLGLMMVLLFQEELFLAIVNTQLVVL